MTCVLCTKRQASRGLTCDPCLDRLAQQLHDIEREATILSAAPSLARPNGTRGGTLASERAPARLEVLALTDPRDVLDNREPSSVLGVLHAWTRVIRDDRRLSWPQRVTVASERRTLATHLQWAAEQPWIDELAGDLADLLARLRRANLTGGPPPVADCHMIRVDGTPCGGKVWRRPARSITWRVLPDRCERITVDAPDGPAHCDTCGGHWDDPHEMTRLELIAEQDKREARRPRTDDGRPMLTADELVAQGHVSSVSNVRVRAHRLGVRAVNGHYDPQALSESVSA